MSLLFDVSPEEPTKKRARAQKVVPPSAVFQTPEKRHSIKGQTAPPALKALGRLDHTHECADTLCRGSAHDIIHEDRGEWLIQCCFCLTCQWVPVIKGHLEPKPTEFQFRDGRFVGLTIDEAVALPRGLDYVIWAAKEHKRPAVKTACETWLARNQSAG
jgi:hypothetical protein